MTVALATVFFIPLYLAYNSSASALLTLSFIYFFSRLFTVCLIGITVLSALFIVEP